MDAAGDTHDSLDERRRIGEIFIDLGFVSREQLDRALEVQRRTGARIGEILVQQGALSRMDLASALAEHWEPQRFGGRTPRPVSLAGASRVVADRREPALPVDVERRLTSIDAHEREADRRLVDVEQALVTLREQLQAARAEASDLAYRVTELEERLRKPKQRK